ncbi:polymeric immunoglobulin receptor-like isoform X2 [Pempheris klunzingeri]|uniref:polymeric immunoglobulin receptor-like isoform X2 n=1 Tax=Pempheris klunzingeri TaxID=3127111 RepID=UPI003980FA3E
MWSLQNLKFCLCTAFICVTSAAGLISVSGYVGREANVYCPYDSGYETYEKYLCRKDCGSDDVLIMTTAAKKSRYSIHDDKSKRVFTATISDLRLSDVGKYWCGVTRTGKDLYTEVNLEVQQDSCCDRSTKVQSYEEGSASISCSYENENENSLKYLCRGNQTSTCLEQAVITSDSRQNGRFSLNDEVSGKFTVIIASLTQKDSGSYLCGVHRYTGLDVFTAVELEVKEWCCVKSSELSSTAGRPVTVQCPYPPQHRDNRKFLCKGDHRSNCTDMMTIQSRFTLQDDVSSGSFSVTITELKEGDAGTYWCGSHSQWSPGNYTKIHLSLVFPQQTSTLTPTITVEVDAALFHPVIFIVPALLLILTFVIVYKYKCYKVQGTGVNVHRSKTMATGTQEEMDIYENQGVVELSKQRTSKPQSACHHYDDAGEDHHESVYQNTTADDIYCNQTFIKAKR